MSADQSGASPRRPDIERLLPADWRTVLPLLEAGYGAPGPSELAAEMDRDGDLTLGLVARRDGALLGAALFAKLVLHIGGEAAPAFLVGPIVVDANHRGAGVGAALVTVGLGQLRAKSAAAVAAAHPRYFARFGFTPAPGLDGPWPTAAVSALALRDALPAPLAGTARGPKALHARDAAAAQRTVAPELAPLASPRR